MSDYITLATSNGGLVKRFWALDYARTPSRAEERESLSSGRPAITRGRALMAYTYQIVVPQASDDPDWGTLADLERFYGYDNPVGTPSDELTLTMHDDTERQVKIVGEMKIEPKTPTLTGTRSYYVTEIELIDVTRVKARFNQPAASMYLAAV